MPTTPIPQARPTTTATRPATAAPTMAATATRRAPWTLHRLLLVAGFGLTILVPAVFGAEGYMFMGPLLVPTVAALVILAITGRPWAYLTAGILGALFPLAATLMFGIFEGQLTTPIGAKGFIASLAALLVFVTVLPVGIGGFIGARRTTLPTLRTGWTTPLGRYAVLVVGLLFGAAVTGVLANEQAMAGGFGNASDLAPEATVEGVMKEAQFVPGTLTVQATKITAIVWDNQDPFGHTFTYTVGGTEYNHEIIENAKATILVKFNEPGTIKFRCIPHSNGYNDDPKESMVGTITVV